MITTATVSGKPGQALTGLSCDLYPLIGSHSTLIWPPLRGPDQGGASRWPWRRRRSVIGIGFLTDKPWELLELLLPIGLHRISPKSPLPPVHSRSEAPVPWRCSRRAAPAKPTITPPLSNSWFPTSMPITGGCGIRSRISSTSPRRCRGGTGRCCFAIPTATCSTSSPRLPCRPSQKSPVDIAHLHHRTFRADANGPR